MRLGLISAGLVLGVVGTAPAHAQEWTLAGQTADSSFLVYVDPVRRVTGPSRER